MTIFKDFSIKKAATSTLTAGTIVLGLLGIGGAPAGAALSMGPTGSGSMQGSVTCWPVTHQIAVDYSVRPEIRDYSSLNSIMTDIRATPEWVDVYAYVKPATSTNWGAPVAHRQVYVDHQQSVLNFTLRATPGVRYNVGFVVRAAYPGQAWTAALGDLPVYTQSVPVYMQGIFMWNSTTYTKGSCMA